MKSDVMLLMTGGSLEAAKVSTNYPGVHIQRVKSQPGGRYLFVWLRISSSAKPGQVMLNVRTPNGEKTAYALPLRARRLSAGNFQGLREDDVIYLIMPDRFADGDPSNDQPPQSPGTYDRSTPRAYHGGDLRGIREHLDYLRDLGVTALWLTPIVDNDNHSPQDYHGYGAVDYYAVDEHLGTLRDLQELVAAAHQKGLKVLLDMVPNHVGARHPWVEAPPEPDWFHGTLQHHLASQGRFDPLVDPHASPSFGRPVVEGWFANVLPDLNQDNLDVAQYLVENALWWAEETGVDGYRLDTFPYVPRRFWALWHRALRQAYPHFFTIGEVSDTNPNVTAFFAGGRPQHDGIDSGVSTVFDFAFADAVRSVVLRDEPIQKIVDVLEHDWLYPHPDLLVPFFGNHDVRRFPSERGSSKEKIELAFSLLLTARGIPEMYSGDEIGMTGGNDPDNRRDFPGGFPGDPRNAFEASGRTPEQQEIITQVRQLLHLRREHPALNRGRLWHIWWDETFYAFARVTDQERILVAFNNANQSREARLIFTDTPLAGSHMLEPLLGEGSKAVENDQVRIGVPGRRLWIYIVK